MNQQSQHNLVISPRKSEGCQPTTGRSGIKPMIYKYWFILTSWYAIISNQIQPTSCATHHFSPHRWSKHRNKKNIYIYILPIGSMYAIYGNIYHQYTPNVSIYTIHGSYGLYAPLRCSRNFATPILLGLTFWRNLYVCGLNLNIWPESHHVQSEHPYFIIFPFEVHNNHRIPWWNPAFSS